MDVNGTAGDVHAENKKTVLPCKNADLVKSEFQCYNEYRESLQFNGSEPVINFSVVGCSVSRNMHSLRIPVMPSHILLLFLGALVRKPNA